MVEVVAVRPGRVEDELDTAYAGPAARHVAMPLGGIGAGQIALGADGGLRQWQIANQINHLGFVPDSFFAIRATTIEPPLDVLRILQSREVLDRPTDPTPLVTDDQIPPDQRRLLERFPGMARTTFQGVYPFARIRYEDDELPVRVALEAFTPFVPLDAEASGLPAILFTFTLHNAWLHQVSGCLAATLQNAVGWDGLTPIAGHRCPLYGGNTNRLRRRPGQTAIVMENPALPDDHPGAGQLVLMALSPDACPYERWSAPEQFVRFLEGFNPTHGLTGHDFARERGYRNAPVSPVGPSPAGTTWNGGLAVPFRLHPGETATITFALAWHFPNRYVNFDQFGPPRDYGRGRFWLGNAYAARFADAIDVTEHLVAHRERLDANSRAWERTLTDSTLPGWLVETLAAQGSLMRSPTCFWTEDGKFFGFEGSLGASTGMWNGTFGGSCPLNCTHVWNYEMALAKLFPALERTMRETDFEYVQAPAGYIPHRTIAPLYLKQLWDQPIGGPTNPALDGMLGTVLKTYREVRIGGDRAWLDRLWPRVEKLLSYILATWDEDGDGVLQGEQPNTYDIAFYGPNMYIGALWLAALRAGEELATLQGDAAFAQRLRERFELGRANYDALLWNGAYYIQILDESTPLEDQFGTGCLADQLFGQWWAHLLGLGYVLPEEHVKATLRSIVAHNVREGFEGFAHDYRVFADRDDTGLLVCTWPLGGRPEVPVRYCDEVWTGIEYQVGAHCIMEEMVDEGLAIVAALRRRYDGTRRNPYNHIECGDHYARAMAGWSVLEALSGFRYDATAAALRFAPAGSPAEFRAPVVMGTGWGAFAQRREGSDARVRLDCAYGEMGARSLTVGDVAAGAVRVTVGSRSVDTAISQADGALTLTFAEPVVLQKGERLDVEITS
ncbi:MAG: GH116 family glycosyl-hydrolase [Thermomicrobiales bacterium]